MKKIFLFMAGLCLVLSAGAQLTIRGKVLSADTKAALPGAAVFCPELNKGTLTSENGEYELKGLRKGKIIVQVSFLGYQTLVETVTMTDTTSPVGFSLRKDPIEVNEVVISGAYTVSQDESPLEIDVIKGSEISRDGNTTLMDAIAKIPGVTQLTTGPYLSRPVIRGLSGNRILTVSDGVRLENQQWDEEHGLGLTDFGLERVEIIKGPASLQYGPEAMGGVVHVVEEQPAPVNHIVGDASIGAFSNGLGFMGNAGLKGATDKFNWKIRGGGRSFSDYHSGTGDRVPNTRLGEGNLKASAGINRSWGSSILNYQFTQSFFGILEPNEKPGAETEDYPREAEAPYHNVLYQKISSESNFLLGSSKLKTVFAFQQDQRGEYEPDTIDKTNKAGIAFLDMTLRSYTYDVKYYLPSFANLSPMIGVQGMYQTNENLAPHRLVPDASVTDLGVFALTKYNVKRFSLTAGIRYDNKSIDATGFGSKDSVNYMPALARAFNNMSGSIGATYDIENKVLLRANYATGYRAPNFVEMLSNGIKLETQRYEKGNTGFSQEHNAEMDASATLRFKALSLEAAVFRNDFRNFIYLSPTGLVKNGKPYYEYTQDDAILQGGEVGLDLHPEAFGVFHVESKASTVEGKLSNGSYIPFIPADRISNALIGELEHWKELKNLFVKVSAVTVLSQSRAAVNELATSDYTLLNLSLGATLHWKKQPIQLALAGNNLLNTKYIDPLSRLKSFGVLNMGTNISVNVKVPFSLR